MSINKRVDGKVGETVLSELLESRGYLIIEKNFTIKGSEIDLITLKDDWIIFFEVKSTFKNSSFSVYSSLTKAKKRALKRGINIWLLRNNKLTAPWRLDFAIYNKDSKETEIYEYIQL